MALELPVSEANNSPIGAAFWPRARAPNNTSTTHACRLLFFRMVE
jgi:hypothetical protein